MSLVRRSCSLALLVVGAASALGQTQAGPAAEAIDFAKEIRFLGGEASPYPWPDFKLLGDPVNNRILNAALGGVAQGDLEASGISDAADRLSALVQGQCPRADGERYRVAFPVIRGQAREGLRELVDRAVAPLAPNVSAMAARLESVSTPSRG